MGNKLVLIISIFVLSLYVPLYSQTQSESQVASDTLEEESISAYDKTVGANQIVQPFSWESAGDVLKYEIVIEQYSEQKDSYVPYTTHITTPEETARCLIYFDPILPPGAYRSTIIVYNILGAREDRLTATDTFVVRTARKPEVRGVSYVRNLSSTIYLDDLDNNGIIEVTGVNLLMPK